MLKVLRILLVAVLVTSCNLVVSRREEPVLPSQDILSPESSKIEIAQDAIQNCLNIKRPLNPSGEIASSESELERNLRLAFEYETEGEFDKAILHYGKAAELANCDCDRLHAEAGIQAATEAKEIFEQEGMSARPTQFFWGRLQDLTQTLPCVEIR